MLSISNRFLFIHIPKTGGNSIQNILRCYSEDRIIKETVAHDGIERFEVQGAYTKHKHADLATYNKVLPEEIYAQLYKFCVVRNPWSRSISSFFSPHRWIMTGRPPVWSRDMFLRNLEDLRPCADFIKIGGKAQDLNNIIRFEKLSEELPNTLRHCGINAGAHPLPHANRSRAKNYRSYFERDKELKRIVGEKYQEDIEHFGYKFEC